MVNYMPDFYDKNKFWLFVFEGNPSLRLVFDNVRNYGIASGVVLAGRFYNEVEQSSWLGWILIAIGCVLVCLNCLQSWVLLLKGFYHSVGFTAEEMTSLSTRALWTSFAKSLLLLLPLLSFPFVIWRFISIVLLKMRITF
jgi:uncharacterized iron-regulated membrane protein